MGVELHYASPSYIISLVSQSATSKSKPVSQLSSNIETSVTWVEMSPNPIKMNQKEKRKQLNY